MSRVLISYEIVGKMVHCVNTNSSSRLSSSLSLFRRNIKPRSYTGFAVASEAVMATPFPPCPPHPQAALHQPLLGTTKSWITTTYWLKNLNDVKGKETIVEEEYLLRKQYNFEQKKVCDKTKTVKKHFRAPKQFWTTTFTFLIQTNFALKGIIIKPIMYSGLNF